MDDVLPHNMLYNHLHCVNMNLWGTPLRYEMIAWSLSPTSSFLHMPRKIPTKFVSSGSFIIMKKPTKQTPLESPGTTT